MTRRTPRPFIFVVPLLFLGIVFYLIWTALQENMVYYYTASEVRAKTTMLYQQPIRVGGRVVVGSVVKEPKALRVHFKLRDDHTAIPVIYQGVVPDTFREDGDAIVEGIWKSDGQFYAKTLLAKCPSKYERRS